MSDILHEILAHKVLEVRERKELYPTRLLEKSLYYPAPVVSLTEYVRRPDKLGIIAEIKRRSPSKGSINEYISVERLSVGYMQAGASALSVLTDDRFFGGSNADLSVARRFNFCPILRKDFIIDEYQVIEAKAIGADVILLIAAALSVQDTQNLARLARSIGLEVLLEVHSVAELDSHLCEGVTAVGVNARDLRTFQVDLGLIETILPRIPSDRISIAESGITSAETIVMLKRIGYSGFLIGEAFMRHDRPEHACRLLIERAVYLLTGDVAHA